MGTRPSKMNVFQIMDYLTSVEKQYKVQDWTINGIHIWPSLRVHIYYKLFEHHDENYTFPVSKASVFEKVKTVLSVFASYMHGLLTKKNKIYDALILDNGSSYDKINDKWFGKFSDPLNIKLKEGKKSLLTLSKNKTFLPLRHTPYRHVLLPVWGKLINRKLFKRSQNINAINLNSLQNELTQKFPEIHWNLLNLAKGNALKTEIAATYFKKLLKKFKPTECYVVTYYNPYNAGFCKACWDLSIPLHEMQHGVQGAGHAAYAQWTNVPETGFNTLPQNFACWQQADVDVINTWANNTPHNAYVLGNLYLDYLKNQITPAHTKFNNFYTELKTDNKPDYLITLQVGMGLNDQIKDIIKNNQDLFFWIRMHPTNLKDMPLMIKTLNQMGVTNYNIHEASITPLYILLPNMDAHITLNSSVVIEAAYFDIPSLILDETGVLYYQDYIDRGQAIFETSSQKAINSLKNMASTH